MSTNRAQNSNGAHHGNGTNNGNHTHDGHGSHEGNGSHNRNALPNSDDLHVGNGSINSNRALDGVSNGISNGTSNEVPDGPSDGPSDEMDTTHEVSGISLGITGEIDFAPMIQVDWVHNGEAAMYRPVTNGLPSDRRVLSSAGHSRVGPSVTSPSRSGSSVAESTAAGLEGNSRFRHDFDLSNMYQARHDIHQQNAGSGSYALELKIAILAVQRAVIATKNIFNVPGQRQFYKEPDTLVTVADFAAQALMTAAIRCKFPNDRIIAEENTDLLRRNPEMTRAVWKLVEESKLEDANYENLLARPKDEDEMVSLIDFGGKGEGVGRTGRVWIIDPINGSGTYLHGTQYAVVIALLEDGKEVLGVIACPRVREWGGGISEKKIEEDGNGLLISAVRGQGAYMRRITTGKPEIPTNIVNSYILKEETKDLVYVEDMASSTPMFENRCLFATKLGANWPAVNIHSSAVTYAALAMAQVNYQIRAPIPQAMPAHVWDHAGGVLICQEASPKLKVTDLRGNAIDFGTETRQLTKNWGSIVSIPKFHDQIVNKVRHLFEPHEGFAAKLREQS
jgi:3'(2'), 5'-bisphosphate nucleotidase